MQVQKPMDELDKWLVEKLKEVFEQMYRKQLSEAKKRGIQAKKLQKGI